MFDTRLRSFIDPPLDRMARLVDHLPVSPNAVTLAGLAVAALAAAAIVAGLFMPALVLIVLNRLLDGLDGAVARRKGMSDLGGFYDIVFDFLFYGAVPLAFALHDPDRNALAASVLLAAFYANGATFLTFAIIAAKRDLTTRVQGTKTIFYFAGIAEGAETFAVFCLFVLFPGLFVPIALAFAVLCVVSAAARIVAVSRMLGEDAR